MRDSQFWQNHAYAPIPRACIVCGRPSVAGRSRCSQHGPKNPRPAYEAGHYGYAHQLQKAEALKDNPICARCGRPGTSQDPLELDHIVPVRLGGTGDPSNTRLLHRSENLKRRGKNWTKR